MKGLSSLLFFYNLITYPFRYAICLLCRIRCLRTLFSPIEWVAGKIIILYDTIRFKAMNAWAPGELAFTQDQLRQMQKIYYGLGSNKWKEGVERGWHCHGPHVFDQGLHGKSVEPGFHASWNRAAHFLSTQFTQKASSNLYLWLHSVACSHFMGGANDVLMGPEKVGVFRDRKDAIQAIFAAPEHALREGAEKEFDRLNASMKERFGTTLGTFEKKSPKEVVLKETVMGQNKMKAIYDFFCQQLHTELEQAQNPDQKFEAICRFYRYCDYSHPVRDGCGRSDLLMLNFLLTQNGFHPVLLDAPYLSNVVTEKEWIEYVRQGLKNWEQEKATLGKGTA